MSPQSPLIEHVTDLRRHLGSRRAVRRDLSLDGLELTSAAVPPGNALHVDLVLESIFEGVTVTGRIEMPWAGECRRCLELVTGTMEIEVHEIFETHPTSDETWPLLADQIDLEPVVRDAALLGLPLAPLCSAQCAGPSPDRFPAVVEGDPIAVAAGDAVVAERASDPRWAALDELDLDPGT